MKIAIIGAGVAGIVSLKYALDASHECDCFEETGEFGGTWVYTNKTGIDQNGLKIYRTMYKDLITNLPKDVMQFEDFPYPEEIKESFIPQLQVLQYITGYVNKFNLEKHIKYHETVVKVQPLKDTKWIVETMNVTKKTSNSKIYDAVFVCNGHFRHPRLPIILGQNVFKGLQLHSGDYRHSEVCKDQRVLIIGAAYSGIDIANQIKSFANKIYLSHWAATDVKLETVVNKPAVSEFQPQGAVFTDGTKEEFDIVIYCTGYEYKFPFLDDDCRITVEDNWVRSLYKHVINIEHPTMCFIGIPFLAPPFLACDIQARFSLAALEKKFLLPSKPDMIKDLDDYVSELKTNNVPQRNVHKMGSQVGQYFTDLAKIGSLTPIRPVLSKLYIHKIMHPTQKNKRYIILDDNNFVEV